MQLANLFRGIPAELEEEWVEPLVAGDGFRIERIASRGHASPPGFWYDQPENEWVMLLAGSAGIAFEGRSEVVALWPGDCLEIPARTRHRVEWTAPDADTLWLAVFYTGRS